MALMFQKSDRTTRIVALFEQMSIGQTLTFEQASTAAGFTFRSDDTAYQSAKNIARRDHKIVIEGVRGVGFKRLNGGEMVKKGFRSLAGIRSAAKRGAKVADIAILQNLNRNEMADATQQLSRFRIIETTGQQRPATSNRPEQTPPPAAEPFDARAALRGVVK